LEKESMMSTKWQEELPKPIAFVFSGGASQGAMQVGMLRALHDAGIEPDLVVGASVGALNGVVTAAEALGDAVERLADLWVGLEEDDIFYQNRLTQVTHLVKNGISVFSNDQLEEMIDAILDVETFDQLRLPFAALATDVLTREGVLFTGGTLKPALLASAALPAVLPPVEVNGRSYMDGAITAYVPLAGAIEMGAASMVVLDAGEICAREEAPANIPEILVSAIHSAIRQRVHLEAPMLAEEYPILYLPTLCARDHEFLDFRDSRRLMEKAEEITAEFLQEADAPQPGRMSGAPHHHESNPTQLVRTGEA
jgi:NTE family protein